MDWDKSPFFFPFRKKFFIVLMKKEKCRFNPGILDMAAPLVRMAKEPQDQVLIRGFAIKRHMLAYEGKRPTGRR